MELNIVADDIHDKELAHMIPDEEFDVAGDYLKRQKLIPFQIFSSMLVFRRYK